DQHTKRTTSDPRLETEGRLSVYIGDRCEAFGRSRLRRVGGAHLGGALDSVNAFLQDYFKNLENGLKSVFYAIVFVRVSVSFGAPNWPAAKLL
ncbi:MAG: hypothetical protein ABJH26_07555, partial [Marinomonas sp.]